MKQLKYNTPDNDLIWQAINEAEERTWNDALPPEQQKLRPPAPWMPREMDKKELQYAWYNLTNHDIGVISDEVPDDTDEGRARWEAAWTRMVVGNKSYPSLQNRKFPGKKEIKSILYDRD